MSKKIDPVVKPQVRLTEEQEKRVQDLLSQMTLKEKIGQMNQPAMSIVGGFDVPFEELIEMLTDGRISQEEFGKLMASSEHDYHEDDIRAGLVGSLMCQDAEKINDLQRIAVEETRLGIPLIFGLDVIHGFRTIYPIAIAEAGSFDEDLLERTAHMAAKEARAKGVAWHFAPMLDIARDSRWGRVSEGPGEDPYLASAFARAKIHGVQGDQSSTENYAAACLKHYVAYGACEAGRDYNTTTMSPSQLRNVYLPPFKAAVEEGAATVMASFNDLNGVPCTVNSYTLRDILKNGWGFDGFVVSDANAIKECITHGIASDSLDAASQAANGGLDMDMGTNHFVEQLEEAVAKGIVSEAVIDEAVTRILRIKMWLGLFEHPYIDEELMTRYDVVPEEHKALAREAGEKSIVLLKNEDKVLPLSKNTKISLVGELADMNEEVVGAWSLSWVPEDCISIRQGFENAGADYKYFACCGPEGELNESELAEASAYGDVIVAVVGEYKSMSGEASSLANTELAGQQRKMLEKLLATGKPVVMLLMNGRPLALKWEKENLSTILECWHLGVEMGNAVANVVFGDAAPEAKLASTFPLVTGQCPIYYNHPRTGRPGSKSKFTSRYLDVDFRPAYSFGYGLTYTTFTYSDMKLKETDQEIIGSITVTNTGDRAGKETVQLYMQDVTGSIVRPVKELKGYKKVSLEAGASLSVEISVSKEDMGFYNNNEEYVLEDGKFCFYMGGDSDATDCVEIDVKF